MTTLQNFGLLVPGFLSPHLRDMTTNCPDVMSLQMEKQLQPAHLTEHLSCGVTNKPESYKIIVKYTAKNEFVYIFLKRGF